MCVCPSLSHTSQPHNNMYVLYILFVLCVCVCAAKDGSEEAGECKERSHEEN